MLRYYSFYMGHPKSFRDSWLLEDIKLPAPDAKCAIILHFFTRRYRNTTGVTNAWVPNKHIYQVPDEIVIEQSYRAVVEYEKVYRPHYGRTLVNFRKIRMLSQNEIVSFFKTNFKKMT